MEPQLEDGNGAEYSSVGKTTLLPLQRCSSKGTGGLSRVTENAILLIETVTNGHIDQHQLSFPSTQTASLGLSWY